MTSDTPVSETVQLQSNRPAHFRKAIVFCCDANYLPFAMHAANRIVQFASERDFDVCVCHGVQDISIPQSLDYLDVRLCQIDTGDSFEGLRLDRGRTSDVYLRIALPAAFAEDYDRILYMDADIFVQGGDFSALLDVDLGPHAIAAVRDNVQWRTPTRQNARNTMQGVPASGYFNAGIMLMDVHAYREQQLMDRCIAFGRKHCETLKRHDQNLYNAVLLDDWAELSPMWNWQFSKAARLFSTLVSPHVIHFIGPAKPWKDREGQFEPRFLASYQRFIKEHFPQHKLAPEPSKRLTPDSFVVTKMIVKHLVAQRKMARYLARFPTDLTVHL